LKLRQFASILVLVSLATVPFVQRGDGLFGLDELASIVDRPDYVLISGLFLVGRSLAVLRNPRQHGVLVQRPWRLVHVLNELRLAVFAGAVPFAACPDRVKL
jgi:hypothetical protein